MKKYILSIVVTSILTLAIVLVIIFSLKTKDENLNLNIETLSEEWINPYSSLHYKYCIPLNPYASDINIINNPYSSYFYKYSIVNNPYGSIFNQYQNYTWSYGSLYSKYNQYKDSGYAYYMNNPYGSTYKKYAGYDYGMNDSYASLFVDYCYYNNPYSSLYMKYKYPTYNEDLIYDVEIDVNGDLKLDLTPNKISYKLSELLEIDFGDNESDIVNLKIKIDNKEIGKLNYVKPTTQVQEPVFINPVNGNFTQGSEFIEVEGNLITLQNFLTNTFYSPIKHAPNRFIVQIDINKDGVPEATGYVDIKASSMIFVDTIVDFKNVKVNTTETKEIEIFNTQQNKVTNIIGIDLNQDQNFRIIEKTDSCKVGTSLMANRANSCKIYIEFNPQVKSSYISNNLKIVFDNAADVKVNLSGVAIAKSGSRSQTRHNPSFSSNTNNSKPSATPKPTVTSQATYCNKPFNDVECDNKLITYISDLKTKKIVKGNASGNFLPSTNVTRAELATFIVNGFGFDGEVEISNFRDVNPSRTHHNNILLLNKLGIVSGYSDGSYRPDQIVKREEVTKFIVNALKVKGLNIPEDRAIIFKDVSADNKFRNYIAYLTTEKVGTEYIMSGTVNSINQKIFNPGDNITREQMAKIIANAVKKVV